MNKTMSSGEGSAFGGKKIIVLSLGGSLIFPENKPDTKFLSSFRKIILAKIKSGHKFILITGGGKICRVYQTALQKMPNSSQENLDWMGIYSTRLNAQLVKLLFPKRLVHPNIVEDPNKKLNWKEKVLIAGGWMPGRSTDDDAVRLAKLYKAGTIINLSNIDHVYTKDPKKFKNAAPIKEISWANFRKIVGTKWQAGLNLPFDPTAAKFAQKHKLKVVIANGKDLKNLRNIFAGKKFNGTIIF